MLINGGELEWEEKALTKMESGTAALAETGRTEELLAAIQSIGGMMRVMNERMEAMEKTIRTLEKVTPGQAAELNRVVRERAAEICEEWWLRSRKEVAKAIRKDLRELTGAKTAREVARCEWQTARAYVLGWEDIEVIKEIQKKEEKG